MKLKYFMLLTPIFGAVILSACNSGNSSPSSTPIQYTQYSYSGNLPSGGSTGLAGVRQAGTTDNVYIAGCYILPNITYGTLYLGPVTGGGTYFTYQYPGSNVTSTVAYSVDNGESNNVMLVGTYTTTTSGESHAFGFYYNGPLTTIPSANNWESINFPESQDPGHTVNNTYPHSIMQGLIVGNYASRSTAGNGFIYHISNNTFESVNYPGSRYTSIYGVWWNGGESYTLAGGYSNIESDGTGTLGFIADYNSGTDQFTNWTSYSYNNIPATITHFEGITTDGNNGYNLAAGSLSNGQLYDSFVHVTRNFDGSLSNIATWVDVWYPGAATVTADTVYQNYLLGEFSYAGESLATTYTATLPVSFYY